MLGFASGLSHGAFSISLGESLCFVDPESTGGWGSYRGGTASATLMPYNLYGDTVEALLTIAIAPKGRHSITLALYLEIDTSRGIVYGDDIEVVDYLMEAE